MGFSAEASLIVGMVIVYFVKTSVNTRTFSIPDLDFSSLVKSIATISYGLAAVACNMQVMQA